MTDNGDDHDRTWALVARAECIVAARQGITHDEAIQVLQMESAIFGRPLNDIARIVVAVHDDGDKPFRMTARPSVRSSR